MKKYSGEQHTCYLFQVVAVMADWKSIKKIFVLRSNKSEKTEESFVPIIINIPFLINSINLSSPISSVAFTLLVSNRQFSLFHATIF